jgi:hypothetical protein
VFPGIEITEHARITSQERLRAGEQRRIAREAGHGEPIDLAQYFRRREQHPQRRTLSTLEKRAA